MRPEVQNFHFTSGSFMFEIEIAAFSKRKIDFPNDRFADAKLLRDEQSTTWTAILTACQRRLRTDNKDGHNIINLCKELSKSINDKEKSIFEVSQGIDGCSLTGKLPVFKTGDVQPLITRLTNFPLEGLGAISGECAFNLYEIMSFANGDAQPLEVLNRIPFTHPATKPSALSHNLKLPKRLRRP